MDFALLASELKVGTQWPSRRNSWQAILLLKGPVFIAGNALKCCLNHCGLVKKSWRAGDQQLL